MPETLLVACDAYDWYSTLIRRPCDDHSALIEGH